ncbi:MAG: glycosyltransferase family 2 protein [Candidatus Poribacteria bacterium]|nr:glycosyltransferase family 2 protein [Candidatus Poribacteria bacterium]
MLKTFCDFPQLSIVIPAYNEAESLPILLEQIQVALKTHTYHCAEVIFINDGSTDATAAILDVLSMETHPLPVHVIHFKHNQGKAEALMAGFAAATGDIVITMDADLQDDPNEIPKLLETLNNGNYDVVSGWKYPRKDPLEKRAFSFVFNRVTTFSTGVKLHDMNCGFKAYRAEVVKELHLYGDLHRYIPILVHQAGYRVGEVKVKHHPRRFGISKYGFKRIPKGFFDLFTVLFLTKYLKRPLHVFGTIGGLVASLGILIGLYLAVLWMVEGGVGFRPLLMLSVLMIILGIQFFSIGLLGELVIGLISRLERRVIQEKTDTEHAPFGTKRKTKT